MPLSLEIPRFLAVALFLAGSLEARMVAEVHPEWDARCGLVALMQFLPQRC